MTVLVVFAAVWLAVGAAVTPRPSRGATEPPTVRAAEAHKTAGPSVCRVVACNALGVPLSCATGFAIGDGAFVVTDLAAMASERVAMARIEFHGGERAVADGFGMADRTIGLVALRIEDGTPGPKGLALAPEPPELPTGADADSPASDHPVVALGWAHGVAFETRRGRLVVGSMASALAEELGVPDPPGGVAFLSVNGASIRGASGVPLVGQDGSVAGVILDVPAAEHAPVVVPGAALRRALIESEATVRPLSELPRPLWPVRRRLPGEPVHPASIPRAVPSLIARLRCSRCKGDGSIKVRRVVGKKTVLGDRPVPVYGLVPVECPKCKGEGVLVRDGLYELFANIAEQATRLSLQPEADKEARVLARQNVAELLEGLAKFGPAARAAFSQQAGSAIRRAITSGKLPLGVIVYAQVRRTLEGPDGGYTLLAPYGSRAALATRTRRPGEASKGPQPGERFANWDYGRWLVLAGTIDTTFTLDDRELNHLRPLAWTYGPNLGPAPRRPESAESEDRGNEDEGERSSSEENVPDFFGL